MNLAQLLMSHSDDRSFEELEKDCGGRPSAEDLERIATKPLMAFPDPDSIRKLARALRVPESQVVLAAAESLALDVSPAVEGGAVAPGPTPESAQQMRNVETLHGADVQPPPGEDSGRHAERRGEKQRSRGEDEG